MMTLYYEGSDGSIIDFMSHPVFAQSPETLTKNSWSYSTISGVNGLGRVKRFYKDTQEATLKLSIMTDTADEFNKVMYDIHRIFDRDVRQLKPGKLWWNGYYKEVFAVETSNDDFEELFEAVEREVTFISVHPYWIKTHRYQYLDLSHNTGSLDYDFDYDFDYDMEELIEVIENDCIDKANFELKFYGPAQNPSVLVGGHVYELLTDLEDGEYAVVNSLTKKITQYDIYGNTENIFHLRSRDSYIFERIPEGITTISRDKNLKVDITLFDERGEPEWI